MSTLSHRITLPYGGNIAYVCKDIKTNGYFLSIFNPKRIRFRAGHYQKYSAWPQVKEAIRYHIKTHFDRVNLKTAERAAVKALIPDILATYNTGDILSCSWGWEQTNVEFVQVIGKTGSRLMVRAISGHLTQTQDMAGNLSPVPESFIGPAFYLNIRPYGTSGAHSVRGVYVSDEMKISSADHWSKTSTKEGHFCSWYA